MCKSWKTEQYVHAVHANTQWNNSGTICELKMREEKAKEQQMGLHIISPSPGNGSNCFGNKTSIEKNGWSRENELN